MSKIMVLECSNCDSNEFMYNSDNGVFTCKNCKEMVNESDAGKLLVELEIIE